MIEEPREYELIPWEGSLRLISLDCYRPFLQEAGLALDHEETVRGVVRDLLEGRFVQAVNESFGTVLSHALKAIENASGPRDLRRLVYWVTCVYPSDGNPWECCEDFVLDWASDVRTGQRNANLSVDCRGFALSIKTKLDLGDLRRRLAEMKAKPLSDWDLQVLREGGLFDVAPGSDYFPYQDALELATGTHRFQECFVHFIAQLSQTDIAILDSELSRRCEGTESFLPLRQLLAHHSQSR